MGQFKILVNKGEGKQCNLVPSLLIAKNPFVFYSAVKVFGRIRRIQIGGRKP